MAEATTHTLPSITTESFTSDVLNFPGVVLVDFWATWCGPCRAMSPRVEALAEKYKDDTRVKIVQVDVDAEPELSQEHQVLSIPTFKVYTNGKESAEGMGLMPPQALESLLLQGINALPTT